MTDANDPRRDRPDHEGRDPQHGDTNDAPRSDETGETVEPTEVPYGSEVPTQQPPAVDFGGDAPTQQQPAVDFGSDAPTQQAPVADAEDRPVVAEAPATTDASGPEAHEAPASSDEEALPDSVPAEYVPGDTGSDQRADADASTDADRRDTEVLSESDRDAASTGRPTEAVPMVAPTEPAQRAWSASSDGTRRPLHDDEALRAAEAARAGAPATGDRGDDTATAASATAATGASSSSHDGWVDDRSDAERDATDRAAAERQPSFGQDAPTAVAPTAAAAGGAAAGAAAGRDTGSHAYPLVKDSGIDHVSVRRELLAQQKEEFGGIRFGAGLLGWFAATGFGLVMITIFGGVLAAWGGVASGSTAMADLRSFTTDNADVLALTSGIVVLAIIFFGYLIGGYTASRIARFSGFKQGLATWLWGLVITIVLAIVVGVVGTQTGDSSSPNPFVPSMDDLQSSSLAGLIGLGLVVVLSFAGAVLGGLLGQRYHRKVDRFFSEED
ncbi:hypothetical protein IFT79_12595 [Frigoribacterium sp. CFBP 8759]|uniref:CvpA family protein n=1 Tax=Frigoribacterium sp. CFBP 8759 TaxID=2775283 RepID=UPI00177EAA3B|nr:CvpA family protein [Frigoribacterium sp. CFBP 8759]MBD8486459.1 hypothetical protein [Frigoribacterium sp. CFBP 8759]